MRDGYSFKSENNGCSIYMSNIFYGHAPLKSGLFLMNIDSGDTHIHSIESKRCRVDNDSATYLWHCRLGHIGKKRIKKLHTDGLLESLDYESLGTCEPCLMGKMTKTSFSGTMERVTDLLEIIHTDCRILGSDRPLGFEHWGARGDLSPTNLRPISSRDLSWKQRTTQGTKGLYWFGPLLWCNTLLQCVVWWIASGADDEQYKGRTAS